MDYQAINNNIDFKLIKIIFLKTLKYKYYFKFQICLSRTQFNRNQRFSEFNRIFSNNLNYNLNNINRKQQCLKYFLVE